MEFPPDWSQIAQRLYDEALHAISILSEEHPDLELACFVLWADPYKGWYEISADSRERNEAGARARELRMQRLRQELAGKGGCIRR